MKFKHHRLLEQRPPAKRKRLPARRPAETGGVAGAIALLVGHRIGINDPTELVAFGVVIGFLPAGITWAVNLIRGGG